MKYYIVKSDSEKGPYKAKQIRDGLRTGTIAKHTLIRKEGGTETKPASVMFPEAPNPYEPPARKSIHASNDSDNVGNYNNGLLLGIFCSCPALVYSFIARDIGRETKRGIHTGFLIGLAVGIAIRVILAMAATSGRP